MERCVNTLLPFPCALPHPLSPTSLDIEGQLKKKRRRRRKKKKKGGGGRERRQRKREEEGEEENIGKKKF